MFLSYYKSYCLLWRIIFIGGFVSYKVVAYCGGDLSETQGVIMSPGFPQVHDIYDCTWRIFFEDRRYLKLEMDTIQLYYKDTPEFWRPSYTRNVCSQSLEIGQKQINCYSTAKDCYIFRRDDGCSIPSDESSDCYIINWSRGRVPIHFTSDGEKGYSVFRRGDFFESHYPKGFKLYYSHNACVRETTTETIPQTSRLPAKTSQASVTSLPTSAALKTTSYLTTRSKGYTFKTTVGIPTAKQHTTQTEAITETTVTIGNWTQPFQKQLGLKASTLIALIISCVIFLLLIVAFLVFIIWRKRNLEKPKIAEVNVRPEMVYSVAYGRLGAQERCQDINHSPLPTAPQTDDGFVYSTVAVRQISNGEHAYVTVGDTYETMPDILQSSADDILYSSVATNPSQDSKTKRKSTFRYQIQPKLASRNRENGKMVENILYEV